MSSSADIRFSNDDSCSSNTDDVSLIVEYPATTETTFTSSFCPNVGHWSWIRRLWRLDLSRNRSYISQKHVVELMNAVHEHFLLMQGSKWNFKVFFWNAFLHIFPVIKAASFQQFPIVLCLVSTSLSESGSFESNVK